MAIRVTGTGTHQGDFQGIAPTGRRVTATGVGIGRIVESWAEYDVLGLLRQLGALPEPERATASVRPPGCYAGGETTSYSPGCGRYGGATARNCGSLTAARNASGVA